MGVSGERLFAVGIGAADAAGITVPIAVVVPVTGAVILIFSRTKISHSFPAPSAKVKRARSTARSYV